MTTKPSVKVQSGIPSLQKTLTIAGIGVALFAAIATVYSFISGQIYIHDILDVSYYGRYAITIIGGFGVGLLLEYFSQKKEHGKTQTRASFLFTGAAFSLLTFSLSIFLDFLRFPLRSMFGDPAYPWGKLVFEGIPLAALILISILAVAVYFMRQHAVVSHRWFQILFVGVFAIIQAATVVSAGVISNFAQLSVETLVIALLGLVITPLTIGVIAYVALNGISDKVSRLFAASIIGTIYGALLYISWEFSTNPEYQATITFGFITTAAIFAVGITLILVARHMVHKK